MKKIINVKPGYYFEKVDIAVPNVSLIGEDVDTVEDVIEPFLMQRGFIKRKPRVRSATKLAYNHLNIPFVEEKKTDGHCNQESMF